MKMFDVCIINKSGIRKEEVKYKGAREFRDV